MRWSARLCGALYHSKGSGFSHRSDAYRSETHSFREPNTVNHLLQKSSNSRSSRAQQPLGLGWASPRGPFTCADTFRAISIQLPLSSCKGVMVYWYLFTVGTVKR